jgi:antitoxin ParD1/3/4
MATRNVVLTQAQDALVERLVASGRFQNASEVMRSGLRLLEEHEADVADLRDRLAAGLAEARAGERAAGTGAEAVRRAFARARAAGVE